MKIPEQSYTHGFGLGLLGFILGGMIGALTTYIIFNSGVMSIVVNFVSPEQPFVRYLFGVVLAFIGISVGGAIEGLVCGYTLHRIDREGSIKRYLLGGAFSTGISQGILVIPILLFISLVSIYNVGSQNDPASFISLFALIGGLFGLVNGAILSLTTLRLRIAWVSWLGFFIASVIGGALFGLLLWRPGWISSTASAGYAIPLYLVLAGATIYGFAGAVLGLIFTWLNHMRKLPQSASIEPQRWQDFGTITLAILIFVGDIALINHLAKFVTVYPGNITTSLILKTEGVRWNASQLISSDLLSHGNPTVGIAAKENDLVAVWSNGIGEILIAYQNSSNSGQVIWSDPVNISKSPAEISVNPQVALGSDGTAYIVWSENGEILFSRCEKNECSIPTNLTLGNQFCKSSAINFQNNWPVVALARNDTIMIAWQVDGDFIGYATWSVTNNQHFLDIGCFKVDITSPYPRLAVDFTGEYWMVLSASPDSHDAISVINFNNNKWNSQDTVGRGNSAEIFINQYGTIILAWCGTNQELSFLIYGGSAQGVNSGYCLNRPSILEDNNSRIHLVFGADRWIDNFGNIRSGNVLMETIQQFTGWSEPTIITLLSTNTQQVATGTLNTNANLAWIDTSDTQISLWFSTLPTYQCDESSLSAIFTTILTVIQNEKYHPKGYISPYCGNHFEELIYLPKANPAFAILPPDEKDGFDQIADLLKNAHSEILFSIMQWDMDKDNLSPGSRIAKSISDLYHEVKADPAAYPRGLTVKILLGNYPNLSTLQMGDQIWNVVQDLADMGVETMEDPSIGWKVEVANYKGAFPHSHTKFIVIDGKTLMAAGFNISWDHLPKDHPSKKGIDMADLGIVITGPIAQTGVVVFDEMWQGAHQLVCEELPNGNIRNLKKACTWGEAYVSHQPESLKIFLPGDTANAIALYRTADYKESDEAYHAALASANESMDAIQANFTAELICDVNMIFPSVCNFNNSLPYMQSLVTAIEQNQVKVRLIVEKENMNGMENRVGIHILEDELARRGWSEYLEIRFFNGRVHTKSILIDDRLLIVGSQNFHYSSISEGGLNELNIATDSAEAITRYTEMFEYYWQQAIPVDSNK
jgi:phosphatidylserine/phosphatidylglycerophosphate/cardiolipin synthase-like enzyme